MKKFLKWYFCVNVTMLMLSLWAVSVQAQPVYYREIEWIDLLPERDLQALLNPPDWIVDIEDGSERDNVAALSSSVSGSDVDEGFYDALKSFNVRPEFDGQNVKIPGFIVPLAFNDERKVTSFFLVPFFGACLHYPPPPPNQIIHVTYEPGVLVNDLWDAYWIEGTMHMAVTRNDMGEAAYGMSAANITVYR